VVIKEGKWADKNPSVDNFNQFADDIDDAAN